MATSENAIEVSQDALSRDPILLAARLDQQISLSIQTGNLTALDGSRVFVGANVAIHPPAVDFTSADYDALSKASFFTWIQPPSDPLYKTDKWKNSQNLSKERKAWILDQKEFQAWQSLPTAYLWIAGRPGCGKSVIATQIIDYLQQDHELDTVLSPGTFVGYGFSSKLDEERMYADSFLRAILWQILSSSHLTLRQKQGIAGVFQSQPTLQLARVQKRNSTKSSASLPLLIDILVSFLALFERSVVIIDGLDECPDHEEFLQMIMRDDFAKKANIKWIFTSQKLQAIDKELEGVLKIDMDSVDCRSLTKESIRDWISNRLTTEKHITIIADNVKKICDRVIERCDEMFLWAVAATEEILWKLKTADDSESIDVSIRSLEQLPSGLDWLLVYLVERITKDDPKLNAKQNKERNDALEVILRWTFHSIRPLTLLELQDILAFSSSDVSNGESKTGHAVKLSIGKRFRQETIVSWINLAYPLILQKDNRIQLMHASFKDIIQHVDIDSPKTSNLLQLSQLQSQMTLQCIQYLLRLEFSFYSCVPVDKGKIINDHPFFEYACANWIQHLNNLTTISKQDEDAVVSFLDDDNVMTWLDAWLTSSDDLMQLQADINILISSLARPTWCVDLLRRILDEHKNIDRRSQRSLDLSAILAWICKCQGQCIEAETLYKDLLDHFGPVKEGCDSQSRKLLHNLALVYLDNGESGDCEAALDLIDANLKTLPPTSFLDERVAQRASRASLDASRGNYLDVYESARDIYDKRDTTAVPASSVRLALNQMAWALNSLGRYTEGKVCAIDAIKMSLAESHNSLSEQQSVVSWLSSAEPGSMPDHRMNLSNFVYTCLTLVSGSDSGLGNLEKSLEVDRIIYNHRLRALGPIDPDTLLARSNLAVLLNRLGMIQESTQILEDTYKMSEQTLGLEHRLTIGLLDNLAANLVSSGKYRGALEMYRQVQNMRMKLLGPNNADTLLSASNICHVLISLNQSSAALDILIPTLNAVLDKLGRIHPLADAVLSHIASACANSNRLAVAEWIYRDLILNSQKIYSEWNYTHITNQISLANCLRTRGKLNESVRLFRRIVSLLRKTSREGAVEFLGANLGLVTTLRLYGQFAEPQRILTKILKPAREIQGSHSLQVWRIEAQIALNHYDRGDWNQSYKGFAELHDRAATLFGEDSDDAIDAKLHMGFAQSGSIDPKDLKEAMGLVDSAEKEWSKVKDDHHRTMIIVEEIKAQIYFNQGYFEKAMTIQLRVLSKRRDLLGNTHHKTLDAFLDLARSTLKLGYKEQAKTMLQIAKAGYLDVFGKEYLKLKVIDSALEETSRTESTTPISSEVQNVFEQTLTSETEAEQALKEAIMTFGEGYATILPLQIDGLPGGPSANPEQTLELKMARLKDCIKRFGKSHTQSLKMLAEIAELSRESGTTLKTAFLTECIFWTIRGDDSEVLKNVIDAGADRTCLDPETGLSPLGLAVRLNKAVLVKMLIACGFDVNHVESTGQSCLDIALAEDASNVVPNLLAANANTERLDNEQRTTLQLACALQRTKIVADLLAAKVPLYCQQTKLQAIHWTITTKNKEIVTMLLDAGTDIETAAMDLRPIHAAISMEDLEMVQLLVSRGAKIDSKLEDGSSAFLFACTKGEVKIIQYLLERGASMNDPTRNGWYPIHAAAQGGSVEVFKFLLEQGLDLNAQTGCGSKMSTLGISANYGNSHLLEWLLQKGSDPNLKMGLGLTPLHHAAARGNLECVRMLISAGADPNIESDSGGTSLIEALQNGHAEVGEFLMKHAATFPTEDDANGRLLRSIFQERVDIARCTVKANNCDVNLMLENLMTPLHIAVCIGNIEMVSLLLDNGADVGKGDIEGMTALHTAVCEKNPYLIELLLSRGAQPEVIDCFGRRPIDWTDGNESCVKAFGSEWTLNSLDVPKISASVTRFTERLRADLNQTYLFESLARCLFLLGKINDAQIALEQTITTDEARSEFSQTYACRFCSKDYSGVNGVMYVCKYCPLLVICESCYSERNGKPTHRVCSHSDLSRIPREKWKGLSAGIVDDNPALTLSEWLNQLEREYSRTEPLAST